MEQNDILKDIITSSGKRKKDSSIFNTYIPKEDVGKKIYAGFKGYGLKDKKFILSDINPDSGLISISQGLITLALIKQFNTNSQNNKITEEEQNIFNKNLTAFFHEIGYFSGNLVYPATPYVKNDSFNYVDSIAKCVQAIMETRELILTYMENGNPLNLKVEGIDGSDLEIVRALELVLEDCLNKLSDLKILCSEQSTYKIGVQERLITSCGWNYTNDKAIENDTLKPSLYFTYSVCLAYMSIYENIETTLEYIRASEDKKKEIEDENKNSLKFERDKAFYFRIQTSYEQFRTYVGSAGLYLDSKIYNLDLRSKFLGMDYNVVDIDEIKGSTTNHAIFNNLFSVVILIASGVSDIYNEYYKERRYFEWLQSIMQNVYDTYCDLNIAQKGYIIDQYILNFNETIPALLYDQVNYLRKQRIQVLTVVPLMVRAYNMVSKWVTQYPQKQMINYLELIMSNRYNKDKDKSKWVWDKDGYDVNINSIYISALYDFYSYYEEYEFPFIKDTDTVKAAQEDIEKKFKLKINSLNVQVNQQELNFEEQRKIYENKINQLNFDHQKTLENLPIITSIKALVIEVLQDQLIKLLPEIFEKVTIYLCSRNESEGYSITNEKTKETEESEFAYKFAKFITAYFSNEIYNLIDKDFEGKDSVSKDKENSKLHMNERYIKLIDSIIRKIGDQIVNKFKEI